MSKLISLRGSCKFFRLPHRDGPPTLGLMLYHIRAKNLVADSQTVKTFGRDGAYIRREFGFTRATLQKFARAQGWTYVAIPAHSGSHASLED